MIFDEQPLCANWRGDELTVFPMYDRTRDRRAAPRFMLPNIRIPLRPTDADVILQLQPLLDACYRRGRYWSIDYTQPVSPKLDDGDQLWAEQLLADKGLRAS